MSRLVRITNAHLADGDELIPRSLWFDCEAGVFVPPPDPASAESAIDLQGRIVAPGFLDLQINGAYGFDFSEDSSVDADGLSWTDRYRDVRQKLITTGTTSFLPTMTSQLPDRYHRNLPLLGPSKSRDPFQGSESLGAHCEGPFFAHNRMGVHLPEAVQASGSTSEPERVLQTYGATNLISPHEPPAETTQPGSIPANVRMITLAPERPGALETIQQLSSEGVIMSIGHMAADYRQARAGIDAGATMITHLYNQMNGHHHREPGPLGILSGAIDVDLETENKILRQDGEQTSRPYFGIIADGNHVHPASVRLASMMHPEGLIVVTDALLLLGGDDGTIDWLTRRLTKQGISVKLEGTDIIAGSCVTLLQCVNNFRRWTGASIPVALQAVTSRPAAVIGMSHVKGSLQAGADADFVVLSEEFVPGQSVSDLVVDEVWKFGMKVFDRWAAIATLFARQGACIFGGNRSTASAARTKQRIESKRGVCDVVETDVTSSDSVKALVDWCIEKHGRIDILVNSVGRSKHGGPASMSEDTWHAQIGINLNSIYLFCHHVLPVMEKQCSGGALVNIASIAGLRYIGKPQIAYAAAKAAIVQLTRTTAVIYAGKRVRLNTVVLGLIYTPYTRAFVQRYAPGGEEAVCMAKRDAQVPMARMGDAWDVARATLFLASDEASYITGQKIVVEGGITASTGRA